ncbi:MAG: hypothetical protein EWM50_06185, partial [Gottschalkiaceae bacterium]
MMDWGKIIMDGIVIAIIGLIAAIMTQVVADFKGYRKIADKIGNHKSDTLEGQHESLGKTIIERTNSIEKIQNSEFNRIFNKVDNIDKEMATNKEANKERYNNLNFDQKKVKDNVDRLVYDWERTIAENRELKGRITELEKKIDELEKVNEKLVIQNRKIRN